MRHAFIVLAAAGLASLMATPVLATSSIALLAGEHNNRAVIENSQDANHGPAIILAEEYQTNGYVQSRQDQAREQHAYHLQEVRDRQVAARAHHYNHSSVHAPIHAPVDHSTNRY